MLDTLCHRIHILYIHTYCNRPVCGIMLCPNSEVVLHILRRELLDCCTPSRGHSPEKIHQTPPNQIECCRRRHQIITFVLSYVVATCLCRLTCRCLSWDDLSGYGSVPSGFPQLSGNTPSAGTNNRHNCFTHLAYSHIYVLLHDEKGLDVQNKNYRAINNKHLIITHEKSPYLKLLYF